MKLTKILGVFAVAASVPLALAGNASATTLEVNAVTQGGAVTLATSLKSGTSMVLTDTFGSQPPLTTCTVSTLQTTTSVFTGTTVSGPVAKNPTFEKCTQGSAVVDAPGTLSIERVTGTTNGTVRLIDTKVTWPTSIGLLTCLTAPAPGTDIARLTGVSSGNATLDINAVLNCGPVSVKWEGTYTVTSPTGLGVVS